MLGKWGHILNGDPIFSVKDGTSSPKRLGKLMFFTLSIVAA